MAIIISSNGEKAVRVDKSSMGNEERLQQYIYNNPESIPLYDIKEDIQLLILAREFSTNSGPIDALGIDKYGDLYIVETKLFNNPDKRKVIAQALDYGAALWKHANDFSDFTTTLNSHAKEKFGQTLVERIGTFFSLSDEDVEMVVDKMRRNLDDGVFHFVVLMDQLDDRLKDLILYVNQNSQFDVYAVELEYYKHETQEIIIPRLFGAEVKKDVGKARVHKQPWDWDSFVSKRLEQHGTDSITAVAKIIEWSDANGIKIDWSSSQRGGFIICFNISDKKGFYPFSVTGDGVLAWNAPHQGDKAPEPFNEPEKRREIITRMSEIEGSITDETNVDGYKGLTIPLAALSRDDDFSRFADTCLWIQAELAKRQGANNLTQ
jgi:hypothetical protein